ncbi:MAG: dihydroorotase [Candidatus Omnitrophota bacterium]|nr:dihydroorotase [Candidatus Omnitrophota bacterium]
MKLLIKGGRVIDPANKLDQALDILIEDSRIAKVAKNITASAALTLEAGAKLVLPGLVDMHVHLREPGREDKETVESGTTAALKGGVTSLLAMANTEPAIDCPENVRLLQGIINKSSRVNVFITAAVTKDRQGVELTDFRGLKKLGVLAVSDDGSSVDSESLMLEALKNAKNAGLVVICHCQDTSLSGRGVVNRGIVSTRMGLRGISNESEYLRVKRDLRLAEKADAPIHIAHLSCAESVELVAQAKKKGLQVTAETAPHYFALDEEGALGFDTNRKMNPPLRSKKDVAAIRQGLKDGTLDAVASDHAPHTESDKEIEFERAEFGVTGLETELAVSITELIRPGVLDWSELVKKLSLNPARILKIDKGTLAVGADADLIVVNPDKEWVVQREGLVSKSKNSPFLGTRLSGVVEYTICGGKIAYKA